MTKRQTEGFWQGMGAGALAGLAAGVGAGLWLGAGKRCAAKKIARAARAGCDFVTDLRKTLF